MTYEEIISKVNKMAEEVDEAMTIVMAYEYPLEDLERTSCALRSSVDIVADIDTEC